MRAWLQDESGATSIEYALLATLIAMVIIASVTILGARLSQIFNDVAVAF